MSFTIVKTVEDGVVFVVAVPEAWEANNILSWPVRPNIRKLRSNAYSKPGVDWTKIPCYVLEKKILHYKDALLAEAKHSKLSTDSEAEELEPTTKYTEWICNNYDEVFDGQSFEKIPIELVTNEMTTDLGTLTAAASNESEQEVDASAFDISVIAQIPIILDRLNNLERDFKSEIIKMQIKLDKLLEAHEGRTASSLNPSEEVFEEEFNFPLDTVEMVGAFETRLDDKSYMMKMVKKYGHIIGSNGHQDGKKVAYILVDKIFSRKVLTHYTWTGNSKTKTKVPFCHLTNIRNYLFTVVSGAAHLISETDLELFFKNCILKHANTRASNDGQASTPRTSTQRISKRPSEAERIAKLPEHADNNL